MLIEGRFDHTYKMSEQSFDDKYGRHKRIRSGIVTHVYDDRNVKVAMYNHALNAISTNQGESKMSLAEIVKNASAKNPIQFEQKLREELATRLKSAIQSKKDSFDPSAK